MLFLSGSLLRTGYAPWGMYGSPIQSCHDALMSDGRDGGSGCGLLGGREAALLHGGQAHAPGPIGWPGHTSAGSMGGRIFGAWMGIIAMAMGSSCSSVLACFGAFIGEAVRSEEPAA